MGWMDGSLGCVTSCGLRVPCHVMCVTESQGESSARLTHSSVVWSVDTQEVNYASLNQSVMCQAHHTHGERETSAYAHTHSHAHTYTPVMSPAEHCLS
mmetsp:Transcript_47143/g.117593  ORF Transcript_47143/g.117593 Transcript_47143/m.117593 type:complete len:98 (-) Transcript_47143:225-518(-)